AVGGRERLAALPDVPTAAEAGLPDWQASSWFGLMAPAGTPADIVNRLHDETVKALRQPAMQRLVGPSGMMRISNSPEEFGRLIDAERNKWGTIIKAANIQAN